MAPLAASRGRLKGAMQSECLIRGLGLAGFAPLGPVFDNPVRQRPLEPDIVARFFRLNPLVLQNLLALRLKFAVKRRVFQQITGRKLFSFFFRHRRNQLSVKPTPARTGRTWKSVPPFLGASTTHIHGSFSRNDSATRRNACPAG